MAVNSQNSAVEIAKALAMPTAIVVVAIVVLIIVLILVFKRSSLKLKVKDWIEVGSGGLAAPEVLESKVVEVAQAREGKLLTRDEISAQEGDEDIVPSPDPLPITAMFDAKSSEEFEAAFLVAKDKEDSFVTKNPEFWETYHVKRKAELSKTDPAPELIKLSETQLDWVWPIVDLVEPLIAAGRLPEADALIKKGLARNGTGSSRLRAVAVNMIWTRDGLEKAIEFARVTLAQLSDEDRASLIGELASIGAEKDKGLGSLLLREVENSLDQTRYGSLWNLAFEYGENKSTELLSFRRYRELVLADYSTSGALNNMGVIAERFSVGLATYHQEEAILKGDKYAVGNIASRLIEAGFLERAKQLLDENGDLETPTVLRARTSLQSASAARDKKIEELRNLAHDEGLKIKQYVMRAFNGFVSFGVMQDGLYRSADSDLSLFVDGGSIHATWKQGDVTLTGKLNRIILGARGVVKQSDPPAGLLVGQSRTLDVLLTESDVTLTAVIPTRNDTLDKIGYLLLNRVESQVKLDDAAA